MHLIIVPVDNDLVVTIQQHDISFAFRMSKRKARYLANQMLKTLKEP